MMMSDAREDGTSINGEYGIRTSNEKQSGEAAEGRGDAARRGASVRPVARAHDIPPNQLFHWRKLYREGLLGTEAESAAGSGLVAVRIVGEQQPGAKQERQSQVDQMVIRSNVGSIQIKRIRDG